MAFLSHHVEIQSALIASQFLGQVLAQHVARVAQYGGEYDEADEDELGDEKEHGAAKDPHDNVLPVEHADLFPQ